MAATAAASVSEAASVFMMLWMIEGWMEHVLFAAGRA
jgi:hypothetical protein